MGDVAFGDVVFVGCQEDSAELDLPGAAGGGFLLEASERLLRLLGERGPVRLFEVGEGDVGGLHHCCGETPPEADEDGKVVGVKGSEGRPVKVEGYVGGGDGEVRGGWKSLGWESSRGVRVEEY